MQPRILVAHDFSTAADAALRWAADLHRSLGGFLIVLQVEQLIPPAAPVAPMLDSPPDPEELDAVRAELRKLVRPLAADAQVDVIVAPSAGPALVAAAEQLGCDLIVMGTRGHGTVARMLLGSVADYVARHAHCPVVTVRAGKRPSPPGVSR